MSDYDNTREDHYDDREESEAASRQEAIDYHAENWITAVTQSVEKSSGTFADVRERGWANFERIENVRKANSVDVFLEELDNEDFAQRAARILIDVANGYFQTNAVKALLDDMAANYADNQYESNIKD